MSTDRYLGKLPPASMIPYNDSGFKACRWCGGDVIPPRRTMCSASCVHELQLRRNPRYMRQCVFNRDKGICSICSIDTKIIARTAKELHGDDRVKFLASYNITAKRKINRKYGGSLWDADHIVRVADGGGQCGLDNIRTLCISCHKIITATGNMKSHHCNDANGK